jgi:hypothetical protein
MFLMAAGAVTAAIACFLCSLAGSTAAGVSKFQVGRAGIPVAGRTRDFFVRFTAGAGVQGSIFFLFVGLCGFWHSFTNVR